MGRGGKGWEGIVPVFSWYGEIDRHCALRVGVMVDFDAAIEVEDIGERGSRSGK